jgi:CRP-like cAMP-binding protein
MPDNEHGRKLARTADAEQRRLDREGERLLRKLEGHAPLEPEDRQALLRLPMRTRTYAADQDLIREGDRPTECCLVLEGFVFRHKLVTDGRRQIISFHPAGDMPDLQSLFLKRMDHSIATLVPARVGFIPHQAMRELIQSRPSLAAALWRETLVEGSIFREWIVGLGRHSAYQRVAHLLCEIGLKLEMVGLGTRTKYELPLTQTELADALGMSTVHANRIVQELRRSKIVIWRGHSVTIPDWHALKAAGEFDPRYLHCHEPFS